MSKPFVPQSYEQWKHCIEVDCGIKLTPQYVEDRIASLEDPTDHYTTQFMKVWGPDQLANVKAWFLVAQRESQRGFP
jgi:hypothetical protein